MGSKGGNSNLTPLYWLNIKKQVFFKLKVRLWLGLIKKETIYIILYKGDREATRFVSFNNLERKKRRNYISITHTEYIKNREKEREREEAKKRRRKTTHVDTDGTYKLNYK